MDIQKSIYGYPKIELWISKNRIMDIRKWEKKVKRIYAVKANTCIICAREATFIVLLNSCKDSYFCDCVNGIYYHLIKNNLI